MTTSERRRVSASIVVAAVVGILAAASSPVRAQTVCDDCPPENALECDATVDSMLEADDCTLENGKLAELVELTLDGPTEVVIDLTSPDFDTYLYLYDEACNQIAFNDDGGDGLNSRLRVTLDEGSYSVACSHYGTTQRMGAFTVAAACSEPVDRCADCEVGTVGCEEPVDDTFPRTECVSDRERGLDLYGFVLDDATPRVGINLNSPEFDTYLHLFDERCNQIAFDDDGGPGLNSRIQANDLAAGTYYVGVSSYAAGAIGAISLDITCGDAPDPLVCEASCIVGTVECGQSIDGAFPETACGREGDQLVNLHELEVGDDEGLLAITLAGDFDTTLILYDELCTQVAAGGAINGVFTPGTYYVGVTSIAPGAAGTYTLTVDCGDAPDPLVCGDPCVVQTIACDDTVDGEFPSTPCGEELLNVDLYRLDVPDDGTVLTVRITTDAFAPRVVLYDDLCTPLASGTSVVSLVQSGTYYVGVSSTVPAATGTFTLEVTCADGLDLCGGDCVAGVVSCGESLAETFPQSGCRLLPDERNRLIDVYEVVTTAGPMVIDLMGDYDTYLYFYDADCQLIGRDDDGGDGLNSHLEIDVAEGVYYIGASCYSGGDIAGNLTIEVTCAGGESFCLQCRTGSIRPDESVQGFFPGSECTLPDGLPVDVVGFNLTEPFQGTISLEGAPFDASVALFDRRCDEIDFNDDCRDVVTNDACLEVSLDPGAYSIVISCRNPDDAGAYLLSVTTDTGETLFFRGDAGGDGRLEIDDAVRIFQWLFQRGTPPDCLETADVDNNGDTNLTDGVVVLQYLFQGGVAPASPGPPGDGASCGADPDAPGSPGDLGCASYAGCGD